MLLHRAWARLRVPLVYQSRPAFLLLGGNRGDQDCSGSWSPWQNGCAERLIGTLRRECLDQVVTSARCTWGEFFPLMPHITIERARTWHYRKMRACIEPSNTLAPLSPFRSWLGCTTTTSGYDFRKGQVLPRQRFRRAVKQRPRRTLTPRQRLGCLLNAARNKTLAL